MDVKSRHVIVQGTAIRIYCSAVCLEERDVVRAEPAPVEPPPPRRSRRGLWWLAAALAAVGCGGVILTFVRPVEAEPPPPPSVAALVEEPLLAERGSESADERRRAAEAALMVDLMNDTWIHPLAGPTRRMPARHTGAFGAERPGERPPECVSGHCGVDVGRLWGEPIYAVHDGVVDFVQRGSNEDRGGMFVRIGHRDGTLFSWYFHLAAIPRAIHPGAHIKAGTLIGLLGDTGVKRSEPHLHFALSVRYAKNVERYLDPEPLLAIWPLWLPDDNRTGGRVLVSAMPGVPVRGDREPPHLE